MPTGQRTSTVTCIYVKELQQDTIPSVLPLRERERELQQDTIPSVLPERERERERERGYFICARQFTTALIFNFQPNSWSAVAEQAKI